MWPCLTATWSFWGWEELGWLRPGLQRAVAQAVRWVHKKKALCRILPFGLNLFFLKQKPPLAPTMLLSHCLTLFHPFSGYFYSSFPPILPLLICHHPKCPLVLFPPGHFSTLSLLFPLPRHTVLQQHSTICSRCMSRICSLFKFCSCFQFCIVSP